MLAKEWIDADPDHAGLLPTFWVEQGPGVDSTIMIDGKGPVFFFKAKLYDRANDPMKKAQVFIQFMPCEDEEARERTRTALEHGLKWLETVLEQGGADEIFFDSKNEKLIAFCIKRLGFFRSKSTVGIPFARLSKRLGFKPEPPDPTEGN